MSTEHQLARQAWVDDQLSVGELIPVEAGLTPAERTRLNQERAFEAALGERLRQGPACPEELWQRVTGELRVAASQTAPTTAVLPGPSGALGAATAPAAPTMANVATVPVAAPSPGVVPVPLGAVPPPARTGWRRWGAPASWGWAAAAGVAFLAGWLVLSALGPRAENALPRFTGDLASFGADAQRPGGIDHMQAALRTAGFGLALRQPDNDARHHPIVPLGMRAFNHQGCGMVALYFDCCGQPVLVIVCHGNDLRGGHLPIAGLPDNGKVEVRQIGGYRVMAVGGHDPGEVLDLFG